MKYLAALALMGFFGTPLALASIGSYTGAGFGGKISSVHYCTCLYYPGVLITVKDQQYFYSAWFSTLYKNRKIYSPGATVLGISAGYSACMQQAGFACDADGGGPLILKIGTSE